MEKYCRAGQARDDNIALRMRIACWTTKPTNPYSQYVMITALPLLQCSQESASVLHYTSIACLISNKCRQMYSYIIKTPLY